MLLRIVSKGFLLTVLGFAVTAWLAGNIFIPDYHGHLFACCGLLAIGAGLLGVVAWLYSERLSSRVRLDTVPLLRIGIPGVIAIYLAVRFAGPFDEFTTGSGSFVMAGTAVLFCFAVGLLPLIAGISLLTGIEGVLVAARYKGTARAALRPVAVELVIGAGLAVIVAYAAVFQRTPIDIAVVSITPADLRSSNWSEREKRLFSAVLRSAACDVLIVPFEAADRSVDRPARSLMARRVAAELSTRSGLCVADPTLVARALGPSERQYQHEDVFHLAKSLGVRWIVRGQIERAQTGQTFGLTISHYARDTEGKQRWGAGESLVWESVAFSDLMPPEVAFESIASDVVENLGIPLSAASTPTFRTIAAELPEEPSHLSEPPGSATNGALRLQLLAVTYADGDISGEHLWERSIIALRGLPKDNEIVRTLHARAALHLYRRPYALGLLEGLRSGEARVLHALSQGNLPAAEAAQKEVSNSLSRIIVELEVEHLRAQYRRTAGYEARRNALLDLHPRYAPWLYVPMSTDEWFQPAAHALVRRQLAAMGVAIEEDPLTTFMRMVASHFGVELFYYHDLVRLPTAIERSYDKIWQARAEEWGRPAALDRPTEWDLFDALYGANRAAVANSAESVCVWQNHPAVCLNFLNTLGPTFRGNPVLGASAVRGMNNERAAKTEVDPVPHERERRLAFDISRWEGGETPTAQATAYYIWPRIMPPWVDEPPRYWRDPPFKQIAEPGAPPASPQVLEKNLKAALRALEFSQDDFDPLQQAWVLSRQLGRTQDVERLMQANQERYVGNPQRAQFLLRLAEQPADLSSYTAMLEARVLEDPTEWAAYPRLAVAQLRNRRPDLARATIMAYPLFRDANADPVALSDVAETGASIFRHAGEIDAARRLYKLSIRYETGSIAEMHSRMRLAQLDHDWDHAIEWGKRLHKDDQSAWGLTVAASLLFLTNRNEEGWRAFQLGTTQFNDSRAWEAALLAHRKASTPPNELVAFAKQWKTMTGSSTQEAMLRHHFLFNMLLVDRPVSDETLRLFLSVAGADGDAYFPVLAPGYSAFRRGNYSEALNRLSRLNETLAQQSIALKKPMTLTLPYVTLSLLRTGKLAEAEALLRSYRERVARDFHYLLAEAYLQDSQGRPDQALALLWEAFFSQPEAVNLAVRPNFQILETTERLLELSGDSRYRHLLLEMAQRMGRGWPGSPAYPFEAKYAVDPSEREHALGMALYLDPQSEHIAGFDDLHRKRAMQWFAHNNPFK